MTRSTYRILFVAALFVLELLPYLPAVHAAGPIAVEKIERAEPVSFSKEVLPILRQKCLACHNESEEQGGLVLENPAVMLTGGDSGAAIVAGNGAQSLLLKLASHADEPVMPPADNLVDAEPMTPRELGLLKLWIDQGAVSDSLVAGPSPQDWRPLPPGINPIYAVAVTADGQFAACSRANQIFIYHVPTGQLVTRLNDPELQALGGDPRPGIAHIDLVQALRFNSAGDMLASSGFRTVKLWRRPTDVVLRELPGTNKASALAVHPGGALIAVAQNKQISLWDASSGERFAQLDGHQDEVTSLRFAGPTTLVSAARDNFVRIWSVPDGKRVASIETPSPLTAIEIVATTAEALQGEAQAKPDLQAWRIVTGGEDAVIRVWQFPQPAPDGDAAAADAADAAATEAVEEAAPRWLERELKGHSGPITGFAAVPNAPLQVVSGSQDGTARHWNLAAGQQLRQFSHGGPVNAVAVRPDATRLATGGENATLRLWNLANGQMIAEARGDLRAVAQTAKIEREQKTATARRNTAKKAFEDSERALPTAKDAATKAAETLTAANKKVEQQQGEVKKASDAKVAAEKTAIETSTAAQQALAAQQDAEQAAEDAAALAKLADEKAKRLAAVAAQSPNDEALKQSAEQAQTEAAALATKAQAAAAAKAEPAKQAAAAVKAANDAATKAAATQKPYNDAVAALEKAASEQNLASQKDVLAQRELAVAEAAVPTAKKRWDDTETKLKEVETRLEAAKKAQKDAELPIRALAFSADGGTLLSGNSIGTVHAWDSETAVATAAYAGQQGPVRCLATLPGNNAILSGSENDPVHVWDANPGWRLERVIGSIDDATTFTDRVLALDFSEDGRLLATGGGEPSRSGNVKIWDVTDGRLVQELLNAHEDAVLGVRFSPDGERVASCGADKFVRLFDVATGEMLRRFEGHTNYVLGVDFNGDGSQLASASADATVKVWDPETGDQRRTISNFGKHVTGIRFIGETINVATSCGDARVRFHRADNGGLARTLTGADDFLYAIDVSADGTVVAAGCHDSVLRIWDANNGQLKQSLSN